MNGFFELRIDLYLNTLFVCTARLLVNLNHGTPLIGFGSTLLFARFHVKENDMHVRTYYQQQLHVRHYATLHTVRTYLVSLLKRHGFI